MAATKEEIEKVLHSVYDLKSVRKSLIEHGVTPQDFYRYLHENPSQMEAYMLAQGAMAEDLAEEIVEIADNSSDPQKARNQIDARKWFASKIKPSKFGDRLELTLNQVVDLKSALNDALLRAGKEPIMIDVPTVQAIDVTPKTVNEATGSKTCSENQGRDDETVEDIFD